MESSTTIFDNVKFEKEKAIARFNRLRRVTMLWQIVRLAIASAAVSWCSARAPSFARSVAAFLLNLSACLLSNHHAVFLIGNAIIVLIFMLCRQGDGGASATASDFHDDYVKFSEAARAPTPLELGLDDSSKQIVTVCADEAPIATSQCDDVAAAIEKAARQIRKFRRNRSEILRSEIAVRPELRRSETEYHRKTARTETAAEMENLSSEEFRRRVDAFIDKHWVKRTAMLENRGTN